MLSSKAIILLSPESDELTRVQDNLSRPLQEVLDAPIIDGVLIERVAVTVGTPLTVKHGLNRKNVHIVVVNSWGAAPINIWRDPIVPTNPNYATINVSASGAVDLYFF